MELYILDEEYKRDVVVEDYESLIWTERFASPGDFELIAPLDSRIANSIPLGAMLRVNESDRIMIAETSERSTDEEGRRIRKLTGRSIEATILESRPAMPVFAPISSGFTKWVVNTSPRQAVKEVWYRNFNSGLEPGDLIPELSSMWDEPPPQPLGDIPWVDDTYEFELDSDSMLETITRICNTFDMGYRIIFNETSQKFHFTLYTGFDRTTGQTNNPAVVFSREMENLNSSTELESIANFRNVAYVWAQNGIAVVSGNGFDSSVSGLNRKVIRVMADDLDLPAGAALDSAMQRRGLEALGLHRTYSGFDGEIREYHGYIYGQDYFLGDLVELRGERGWSSHVRVTEQIFVNDARGFRKYPTLTTDLSISPDTWLGWSPTVEWIDVDEYWSDV